MKLGFKIFLIIGISIIFKPTIFACEYLMYSNEEVLDALIGIKEIDVDTSVVYKNSFAQTIQEQPALEKMIIKDIIRSKIKKYLNQNKIRLAYLESPKNFSMPVLKFYIYLKKEGDIYEFEKVEAYLYQRADLIRGPGHKVDTLSFLTWYAYKTGFSVKKEDLTEVLGRVYIELTSELVKLIKLANLKGTSSNFILPVDKDYGLSNLKTYIKDYK